MTLIEVLVAATILGPVAALFGVALLHIREFGERSEKLTRAVLLASNAIEAVRMTGDPPPDEGQLGFDRIVMVSPYEGNSDLLEVVAEVRWRHGALHRVALRTLIFRPTLPNRS
jgi:Tfp pilus assembly protein PilV